MASVDSIPYANIPTDYGNKRCGGCGGSVDDGDGIVVSFGDSYWHVECFKCAKCNNRVSPDTNILLLSDGSPVCSSCSYNCAVCKKPISHEAIMAGDESYHAACFACKTCGRHIGELVFAKTTQGIYCMECHNERIARRKQRKNKEGTARDKARLRDQPSIPNLRDGRNSGKAPTPETPNAPAFTPQVSPSEAAVSRAAKRVSTQPATLRQYAEGQTRQLPIPPIQSIPEVSTPLPTAQPLQSQSTTTATIHSKPSAPISPHEPDLPILVETIPLPSEPSSRRRSFDDGVRPLNVLLNSKGIRSSNRPNSAGTAVPNEYEIGNRSGLHVEPVNVLGGDTHLSPVNVSSPEGLPSRDAAEPSRSPSPLQRRRETPRNYGERLVSPGSTQPRPLPDPFASRGHSLENGRPKQPTTNGSMNSTGRMSPMIPNATGLFSHRSSTLSEHTRAGTPMRDLPSLPQEVVSDGREDEITDDEQMQNDTTSLPLALPPISFSDLDSFGDLLSMTTTNLAATIAVAPPPYTPKNDDKRTSTSSNTHVGPNLSNEPVRVPNDTNTPADLPKRNESLIRGTPNRKPAPEAIILPDTLDLDLTYDLDDYITPASPETSKSLGDSTNVGQTSGKSRPGSTGQISEGTLHSQSRSRHRSASVNAASPSTLDVAATPRSVSSPNPVVMITESTSDTQRPTPVRAESLHLVSKRIREALDNAAKAGETVVEFDREFVEILDITLQSSREKLQEMEGHFDGIRRASQQFIEGLTVAQEEYDIEVSSRREAEAEVKRLKVQLSGQTARLTGLLAEDRKRDVVEQMSRDMNENLHGLERYISKLKAERDLTVAEMEELASVKTSAAPTESASLHRGLTKRFDTLKSQYKRELEPLVQQREALAREINQLKEERNICLEETTALNARNEELSELINQITRQLESNGRPTRSQPSRSDSTVPPLNSKEAALPSVPSAPILTPQLPTSPNTTYLSPFHDEISKLMPNEKKKKVKPSKDHLKVPSDGILSDRETTNNNTKHNFQHYTILRSRCDHCGDKMWGTQLKCTACNIACHSRCVGQITSTCSADSSTGEQTSLMIPTVFGRELIEQVRVDSALEHHDIPIIVEKCISAVETSAMDYEGIYRKTGGSSQSKAITQLFERGHYETFDLHNPDSYNNDISSVTSVLKTYFRQLPNPLLTHALHEAFIQAAIQRDARARADSLGSLVYQLPSEHFHTLRHLMLHLYRVQRHSEENLMNARNLGVVFGPTLMRSSDPNREFADMAGKALAVEWLIENAPDVFREPDI